jgi:hypothetical protein
VPPNVEDLSLHEQVLLLALRDEKGTLESRAGMYAYALGGAILAELLLAESIRIGEEKKQPVEAVASKTLTDPILEECRAAIAGAKRRKSAQAWVSRFAGIRRLKHKVAEELCRKGVLRGTEDQILLLFTRKIYPTTDPGPERHLVERMREAIFGDGEKLDPRVVLLVALAHAAQMLPIHFPKKDLKRRKERLARIVGGELIGGATRAAVQAAQSAVRAAVLTAVVIGAASHSSH